MKGFIVSVLTNSSIVKENKSIEGLSNEIPALPLTTHYVSPKKNSNASKLHKFSIFQ